MVDQNPLNRLFNDWIAAERIDDGIGQPSVQPAVNRQLATTNPLVQRNLNLAPTAPMGHTQAVQIIAYGTNAEGLSRVQQILQLTSMLGPGVSETDFAHTTLLIDGRPGPFKGYIASEVEVIQWWRQLDAAIYHRGGYDEQSIIEILHYINNLATFSLGVYGRTHSRRVGWYDRHLAFQYLISEVLRRCRNPVIRDLARQVQAKLCNEDVGMSLVMSMGAPALGARLFALGRPPGWKTPVLVATTSAGDDEIDPISLPASSGPSGSAGNV